MSDWAAKLSQKPVGSQLQVPSKIASPKLVKPSAKPGAICRPEASNNGSEGQSNHKNQHAQHQKLKPSRIVNSVSPVSSSADAPEGFNGSEVLAWLNNRYIAELEEAQKDKMGENAAIYRSLESSSSWQTKGPGCGRRHSKEDDRFDLLSEINRSIVAKTKKN